MSPFKPPAPGVIGALLLLLAVSDEALAQQAYVVGPAPPWVSVVRSDLDGPPPTEAAGVYFVVVDDQVRVSEGDRVAFSRVVLKVLNQEGIQDASRFSIDFDPAYQRVTLHDVFVHRGEQRREALRRENVSVLQRETALERQLYDGRKTVNVILDDLRVGDVVEYSFSVRGANPVFKGRFARSFYTRFSAPVHRFQFRLLWPSGRTIHVTRHGDAPEPRLSQSGGFVEYVWQREKLSALVTDGDTPDWYEPYPWVQISEWTTWSDVVRWAQPMFEPMPVSDAAREVAASASSPEERLLASLRFTQDEVRYLGFSMGSGSHEPRAPRDVLRTRFGDCKDKARLLVSLLAALGVEAYPALVNTSYGPTLDEWHPTPLAFDHAIVVVYLGGRTYWLDPTLDHQRGDLDHVHQPDYGGALLIRRGVTALVAMNPPRHEAPNREVETTFDLTDGLDEPALYHVRTIYYGADADGTRRQLARQSREELANSYLNYYAASYPGIEPADSLAVNDDHDLNRLIVDERYLIRDLWERSESERKRTATFYATETRDLLLRPATSFRSMPLGLLHPFRHVQTITALLPQSWNVQPERVEILDEAAHYTLDVSYAHEVLTMRYEYESRTDHVMPDNVAAHLKNVDKMFENTGYEMYRHDDAESNAAGMSWGMALLALLALAGAAYPAVRAYRYEPTSLPLTEEERDPRYVGLRGWLLLVALAVVISPFRLLGSVVEVLQAATPATLNVLTDPQSASYHALWMPLLTFEIVANTVLLAFAVLCAVLFFQQRQTFPRIYSAFLLAAVVVLVVDTALTGALPATMVGARDIATTATTVVSSGIWIAYFRMSKRVESTFVRRRMKDAATITTGEPAVLTQT